MHGLLQEIHALLRSTSGQNFESGDWAPTPDRSLGDIAIPCFKVSKILGQAPAQVANNLAAQIQAQLGSTQFIERAQAKGPYINFFFKSKNFFAEMHDRLQKDLSHFGARAIGQGKRIVIDFSSPNIAKEIALHHLRSTSIGNALARIAKVHGYQVERINYLGDWGTTHGKVILAIQRFGDEDALRNGGLPYLLDLYVRFNQEEKANPQLSEEAKACFQRLESGDTECRRLWELYKEISIEGFKKTYHTLGIEFDHFDGESLYENKLQISLQEVREKIGTRMSEGAEVVDLPGQKIPALLRKDDGASLYLTRDLAAAEDRFQRFHFDQIWYVVAVQQKLHFEQLKEILTLLKKPYAHRMEHVAFGMLSMGSKTMKTREGNVLILSEVLEEATKRAAQIIADKNPSLKNADRIAAQVGVGAVIFSDLSQHRSKDVAFSWEKALSFEGDTAPNLQYTHARCQSLREKCLKILPTLPQNSAERDALWDHPCVRQLLGDWAYFESYSERALRERDPSQIATALLNISKSFNQLYHKIRFLNQNSREALSLLLDLTQNTQSLLRHGLWMLGIEAPEEM